MADSVLDTSVLIHHYWKGAPGGARSSPTEAEVARRASRLIALHRTRDIVTAVELEFLAGARSKRELTLFRKYLQPFALIDDGKTVPADWQEARQLVQRVPRDGKPRQVVDCLIAAIAWRLKRDVITYDLGFPRIRRGKPRA